MRVLILSQYYPPEPDMKIHMIAEDLASDGHEVLVITGQPNYPYGRAYPGYSAGAVRRETVNGVRVWRLPLYPDRSLSAIRRGLNYLTFALSASFAVVLGGRRRDVAWVHHPPLTIGLPALVLRFVHRVPIVYEVQDLWPDTLISAGQISESWATQTIGWFASVIYRQVDHVTVISQGFRDRIAERGGKPEKVSVVPNWADEHTYYPVEVDSDEPHPELRDGFNVLYAGTVGPAQQLDVLLDAAHLCRDTSDVRFAILGDGPDLPRLRAAAADRQLGNVVFLERVPVERVRYSLAQADCLLVHLRDDPLYEITIPSKIVSYLACGQPIVAGLRGEPRQLLEKSGAANFFEPGSAPSLADGVRELAALTDAQRDALGASGRRYYEEHLTRAVLMDRYRDLFKALSGKAGDHEGSTR